MFYFVLIFYTRSMLILMRFSQYPEQSELLLFRRGWCFLHQKRSYVDVVTKHFYVQRNELNKAKISLSAFVVPISLSIFM